MMQYKRYRSKVFLSLRRQVELIQDHMWQKTAGDEVSGGESIKLPNVGCLAKDMIPEYDKLVANILHGSAQHNDGDGISFQTHSSTKGCSEENLEGDVSTSSEDKDGLEKEHQNNCQATKSKDAEPVQPMEAKESSTNQVDALRFEVSQYTGRIHLYSCISGEDSRPRPLFENFRPEELEALDSTAADNIKGTSFKFLKENPGYLHALLAFMEEWKKLRPIEQKKLLGKPLQLPLTIELCYLCEGINHDIRGLLKGGSKRRSTPFVEISKPLPSNAVWKKVYLRSGYGKKEKEYTQGFTLTDDPLCKLCQTPCTGHNAKTPEYFEDLFCQLSCYEEYRIRTSNRSLRHELFQLERGVCTICQLDCHKLVEHLRPLSLAMRRQYIENFAPRVATLKKPLDRLVKDPKEGNAWHADHFVPVYRGGGECRLENMRTLCVACHRDVTKAQCAERLSTRIRAKKKLKAIMNDIKKKARETNLAGPEHIEIMQEDAIEDELFVKVPGSAYSLENQLDATTTGEDLDEPSSSNKVPTVDSHLLGV